MTKDQREMQVPVTPDDQTDPQTPVAVVRRAALARLNVPLGLVAVLGAYLLLAIAFLALRYWLSDDYQSARHYREAQQLLGPSGRPADRASAERAYQHLLEAARLKPEVKTLHDQLESLNARFDERRWKLPPDLKMRAEAVALRWTRLQEEHRPILVVGARDRGWDPESLAVGPGRAILWFGLGFVLLAAVLGYRHYTVVAARRVDREEEAQRREDELEALAAHRRRDR